MLEQISSQLLISSMSVLVALGSLLATISIWRASNRPLVTARVTSNGKGGNVSIPLSLLVENTGNRPAKNIALVVSDKALDDVLLKNNVNSDMLDAIRACFSKRGIIPILANGKTVQNGFGILKGKTEGTWKPDHRITIKINYEDLDGRKFSHKNPLLLSDDSGFAGYFWGRAAN